MGCCCAKPKPIPPPVQMPKEPPKEEKFEEVTVPEIIKPPPKPVVIVKAKPVIQDTQLSIDYDVMNPPLSKGPFGEIRKAVNKKSTMLRQVRIIKKQGISPEDQNKLKSEHDIHKTLEHNGLIKVYEQDQDNSHLYFVTDLCTGAEVFDKIIEERKFNEFKAALIMKQILSAVNALHFDNIVHRDIQPENFIYESNKPDALLKLVGYEHSIIANPHKKLKYKFGNAYFISPEGLENNFSKPCDIWSCGIILYIMLCGYPPFKGKNEDEIIKKIKTEEVQFETEDWEQVSIEAKNLVCKMLEKDPSYRIDAFNAAKDSWFDRNFVNPNLEIPNLINTVSNLRNFRADRKLQKSILTFFYNNNASKQEKFDLIKEFKELNTNKDGKLSREDLEYGYKKFLSVGDLKGAEEELNKLNNDKSKSAQIDYKDWLMAVIGKEQTQSKIRIDAAFKLFDKDGNETLQLSEFQEILGNNSKIPSNIWRDMSKEFVNKGDGKIQFSKFKEEMLKVVEKENKNFLSEVNSNIDAKAH